MGTADITFSRATTQRASEVIYEQIYNKIASGELKNGDRLPSERELAEMFGRSRPSVREALRMLQQDGLVEISVGTNGGATVQGISLDLAKSPLEKLVEAGTITPRELVEYRAFNDRCCVQLALQNHTDEDIAVLLEILDRYEKAVEDSVATEQADRDYHTAMAKASHNKLCILITAVVTQLCNTMYWNVLGSTVTHEEEVAANKEAYQYHRDMVDAIIAKDAQALMATMEKNVKAFSNIVAPTL